MPTPIHQLQSLINTHPKKNMSDMIYEKISQLIQSGEFPEGYIFPNEAVLCEQLSVWNCLDMLPAQSGEPL